MRKIFLKIEPQHNPWLPLGNFSICERNSFDLPANYREGGRVLISSCLFCETLSCLDFNKNEHPDHTFLHEKKICPKAAISLDAVYKCISVSDVCNGCGLCIVRCPYGAIFFNSTLKADVNKCDENNFHNVKNDEFSSYFSKITTNFSISEKQKSGFINKVKHNVRYTNQDFFYPFIGNILTSLGLPASISRTGDTNDRMDAKIFLNCGIIPVEIKSPTETDKISVKAVRQALENKIILLSRTDSYQKTDRNVTSLIIGYDKPNERSDISELIEDIFMTYQIHIGILSMDDLLDMLVKRYCKEEINLQEIVYLKGFYHENR